MAKTTGPTPAEILWNQNSILAARSQRILQSLLGHDASQAHETKAEGELEDEDVEIFKPIPDELLGPGFPTPEDGEPSPGMRNGPLLAADEQLRKQLLGKNAKRARSSPITTHGRRQHTGNVPPKPRPAIPNRSTESDEEDGRSSLGRTKRGKLEQARAVEVEKNLEEEGEQAPVLEVAETLKTPMAAKTKRKPGSYLDEILSERSKKKQKKKASSQRGNARLP